MAIEEIISAQLSTITGLSGKVQPVRANQATSAPYLVYRQTGGSGHDSLNSFDGPYKADYELNILATTYASMKTIAAAVLAKLKSLQGNTYSGTLIQAVMVDENSPELEEIEVNLYRKIINLSLIY